MKPLPHIFAVSTAATLTAMAEPKIDPFPNFVAHVDYKNAMRVNITNP